jgi:hypothetical protein
MKPSNEGLQGYKQTEVGVIPEDWAPGRIEQEMQHHVIKVFFIFMGRILFKLS